MKRIYTFGHEQVERNITVGDIIENKQNNKKMTQVTAANEEEAHIIAEQNIDMIITGSDWYKDVRKGAPNTFITAALFDISLYHLVKFINFLSPISCHSCLAIQGKVAMSAIV